MNDQSLDSAATPSGPSSASADTKKKVAGGVALATGGCCLLIFLFVLSIPSIFGYIWNQNNPPIVESTNAPVVNAFLGEVAEYAPTVSRFKTWTGAVWAYGMNCPDYGDEYGDACQMSETIPVSNTDHEAACRETFEVAKHFGALSDQVIGEAEGMPFGDGSLERCVTMMSSYPRSVGWGWFGPEYYIKGTSNTGINWVMMLTSSQKTASEPSDKNVDGKLKQELFGYSITIGTDFRNAYSGENKGPDYSDKKIQAAAMLDTVAYYRRSNKDLGVFSKNLIDQVLPIYKSSFRFDGDVKSFADSNKEIRWVQMSFKDGPTWCISIGVGDDLTAGTEATLDEGMDVTGLPGGTVELAGLGKPIESRSATHKFGDYVVGACK